MKTNVTVPRNARQAEQTARNAATSKWMSMLARLGYAMKGVVYLIIGWLAVELAIGHGGAATDQRGALRTIYEQPFGKFLLVIVAIGLIGFAIWCFIQAVFDTEAKGKDAKGIIARIGYAIVGIAYAGLAYGALQLALGTGNGGKSSTQQTQTWTALLLKQPFGVALVVIVGLVVLGLAVYLYAKAYTAKFQNRLGLTDVAARLRKWVVGLGRFGYAALGVVFTIIGIFMVVAALQHNPNDAKGLDSALQELLHQPFGPVLLGIVALGLIAYGIYSLVEARYRRVGRG
jgi:membrane protease YdiL (CAAX protease family)